MVSHSSDAGEGRNIFLLLTAGLGDRVCEDSACIDCCDSVGERTEWDVDPVRGPSVSRPRSRKESDKGSLKWELVLGIMIGVITQT